MNNLESQMWSLNERYGILSANYGALREKFENYQTNHASPKLLSLIQIPEMQTKSIPRHLHPISPIVRILTMNPQPQRYVQRGPINQNERKLWIGVPDESDVQESKRRKQNISEGVGLQAMATAAASLHCHDTVPLVELPLPRSSLADLLFAASFNSCEGHQAVTQVKAESN